MKLSAMLGSIRQNKPLIHHITNYVTVNDCANITLCIGASPVMSHALEEVEEMVGHAGALVLNIGTLDPYQATSMLLAGQAANNLDIPVIVDPVGAGATSYRTDFMQRLIEELEISVMKGNAGEIGVLAGADAHVRGVDSGDVNGDLHRITQNFAHDSGITIVMSGATDIVSNGRQIITIKNGHPMMGRISGTGCMATSVIASFVAVSRNTAEASAAALAAFGIAGERAAAVTSGPGAFKSALFDQLSHLTPAELATDAKIREL
ncbi:MAG: hydroxyethylthiazole kinase [Methanomicrobiales archaeon]|nr:hydroxyethylthiazole kinase [Methanomicrobiales archaeon]